MRMSSEKQSQQTTNETIRDGHNQIMIMNDIIHLNGPMIIIGCQNECVSVSMDVCVVVDSGMNSTNN